jgi:hypothetical protein
VLALHPPESAHQPISFRNASKLKFIQTQGACIYFVKRLFLIFGLYLQKAADPQKAAAAIDRFRPTRTEHNLIRVGGSGDGGYLIPESQVGMISAVFSPGVADVADFELFFAERGVKCFLIDGSVNDSPSSHENMKFEKLWLSEVTVPGESVSLNDWVTHEGQGSSDLLLQIDIEGAEFETLLSTPEHILMRFRVIVIEIHDMQASLSRSGSRLLNALASKINATHTSVHLHVNNAVAPLVAGRKKFPEVVEVTFLRNDLINKRFGSASLPHPLDAPNTLKPDWTLD